MDTNYAHAIAVIIMFFLLNIFIWLQETERGPLYRKEKQNPKFDVDDLKLINNPLYRKFNISPPIQKKSVNIIISVMSAPGANGRRNGIRKTWFKDCVETNTIIPECLFFTDKVEPSSKYHRNLTEEATTFGDMRFGNTPTGLNFGIRLLFQMVYFSLNYEFDYLLRIDDDYFLCMNRFLRELPYPVVHNFVWGWVHCDPGKVRTDEGSVAFSRDVVHKFVNQNPYTIKCHPYGDQTFAIWMKELDLNCNLLHDSRLHHHPVVNKRPKLRQKKNICKSFIGIHGATPEDLQKLSKHKGKPLKKVLGNLITNSHVCKENATSFDWTRIGGMYQRKPKPCIDNPVYGGIHYSRIKLQ